MDVLERERGKRRERTCLLLPHFLSLRMEIFYWSQSWRRVVYTCWLCMQQRARCERVEGVRGPSGFNTFFFFLDRWASAQTHHYRGICKRVSHSHYTLYNLVIGRSLLKSNKTHSILHHHRFFCCCCCCCCRLFLYSSAGIRSDYWLASLSPIWHLLKSRRSTVTASRRHNKRDLLAVIINQRRISDLMLWWPLERKFKKERDSIQLCFVN